MAAHIDDLIAQATQLPRKQRVVLLAALSDSLREEAPALSSEDFWTSPSLEDISREQNTSPVTDWRQLVAQDIWPEDEPIEEFEAFQEQERHRDIQAQQLGDELR